MPGPSRSSKSHINAAGGGNAQSLADTSAVEARLFRIDKTPLQDLQAVDVFAFLSSKVSDLRAFENSWRLSGLQLISFMPQNFIRALQLEFLSFPFSLGAEIFKVVQNKIISDNSSTSAEEIQNVLDRGVVDAWVNSQVPSFQVLLGIQDQFREKENAGKLPAVVPVILDQMFSPGLIPRSSEILQSSGTAKNKFTIGGPRTPLQNSLMANYPGAMFSNSNAALFQNNPALSSNLAIQSLGQMVASAAPLPHNSGQMAASAAPKPGQSAAGSVQMPQISGPMVTNVAQMPGQVSAGTVQMPPPLGQTVASAAPKPGHSAAETAQMPPFYNSGPMTASAVQMPANLSQFSQFRVPFNQSPYFGSAFPAIPQFCASPVQYSPSVPMTNELSLQGLLQNPQIAQLFHTIQAQHKKSKPIMPWEAAALANPFVQDPSMPKGYKRLSMATIIADAKAERAKNPSHVDTGKAIIWPEMQRFTKDEFIRVRTAYYGCLQKSFQSGLISSFKSCMTLVTRNAAMGIFGLNDSTFGKLNDDEFMNWCALLFGPRNKKEAIKRLKSVKIFHRDSEGSIEDFLVKFDAVCYEHEAVVNDIVDSQSKWPFDEDDVECSALTEREITKEWKEMFPKQDGKVFSHLLKTCRRFIEQNIDMPFNVQVHKLRHKFEMKILDAEEESDDSKVSRSAKYKKQDHSSVRGVSFGGLSNQPTHSGNSHKRSAPSKAESKSKFAKKVVPGHARGLSCGSLNNHFGLGCHKDTCPAFGTDYDKSRIKPHVWKSSEDEPSVRMPEEEYNGKLKSNPKILANWKQAQHAARSKPKVKVAAFASVDSETYNQDEIDRVVPGEDDDHSSESELSDNEDEVKDHYYFDYRHCDVAATRAGAASLSNAFEELGHEEQFYGVTRFAGNDDFKVRTLMDPGATINIISPMMANRSALYRRQLAVNIFQGKRKMAAVDEMVKCAFELMNSRGEWQNHIEWFAVCDLGYDILLGRRFCRVQQFTSFDEKLMCFDALPESVHALSVSAFSAHQELRFRFDRVPAPEGEAKYKRKPKVVVGLANRDQTSIGKSLLNSANELSNLLVIDRRSKDNEDFVLLQFTVDTVDFKGSAKKQHWFKLVDGAELQLSRSLISKLMVECKNVLAIKSIRSAQSVIDVLEKPKDVVVTELSDAEVSAKKAAISADSQNVRRSNVLRFASYHPVSGYRLKRNAEKPPLSPHWTKDHLNYEAQRDYKGERARIEAAVNAAKLESLCKRKHRKYCAMTSTLASQPMVSRGVSASVDCWLEQSAIEAKVSACDLQTEQQWSSEFEQGEYVEIVNAVVKPEFNGCRVRLFGQTEEFGVWVIRLLGKNEGKRRCHERLFKKLSQIQQQQSIPSGASAGFDDVGIDSSGQPNVEIKTLAHRQFGVEYSEELTRRINLLKANFPDVFSTDVSVPCDFEPMKIRLIPNAVLPSKARFYRNTPKMREEVKRQIQEQLDWGAIRKCVTPCVSDVLLVKRPHMPGKFRFVVNYIKLNDATVKEQLLMPDPKSQHERLAGCSIFGALDCSSYYRQLRLHEDSQYLTGFASDEGTFCYTRVPMGITGACQYAQKVLQDALAEDPFLGPLGIRNYFDDLPFGAKTEDEFMEVLEALLNFCRKWKLKINPEKTVLGVKSITHVGFVVSKDGVSIDPERTRDIKELTPPKSVKKVQSILGIFNYVRNFIPDFSTKAKFLTDKLGSAVKESTSVTKSGRKRDSSGLAALSVLASKASAKVKVQKKFEWTDSDQVQFEALKECVLNAPLLAQLDYSLPIYIRCDASRFGCGAVLFQYDERGYEFPVCYASRKFLPAEQNWSTFSQEASTVVWALERFNEYTQGYHVIVECDHRNISFVKKSAMPQLARWRLRLQDIDFSVRYLSGPQNLCSDGLSRQHVDDVEVGWKDVIPECALADVDETVVVEIAALRGVKYLFKEAKLAEFRVSEQELANRRVGLVATDPLVDKPLVEALDGDVSSDSDDSINSEVHDDLELEEALGVVDRDFGPNGEVLDDNGQPIVRVEQQPEHLAVPLLDAFSEIQAVHNDLLGHAGAFVTLQRALKNGRIWASRAQMLRDVDNFIRGCPCCQKMRKRRSQTSVERHVISGSPFAELSIDLLKLPKPDALGMAYVVVIVDSFSHWTSLIAVRNKSVFEAARALVKVVGDFGVPMRLRSDGGGEFVNGVISGLTRMMGVTHHTVVPYTPQANGIVERANRSILERLRAMVFSQRLVRHSEHVWSDLLPLVQRAINASVHSATGTSPARILFGDNLDLDRCLLTHMPNARDLDVTRYVDALTFNQRIILETADKHQSDLCAKVIAKAQRAQMKAKKSGDLSMPPFKQIEVNDWVLVSPGESYPLHKLSPRWLGPFRVLQCSANSEVVVVEDTLKRKVRKFLRRQLEIFDISQVSSVEGLTKVAESDGFEFPVESILGHALIEAGGVGVAPVQLPQNFKRGVRPKKMFQFLVKWSGYEEPTWIEYKVACRLVQFPGYVAFLPNLRMD